jgi:hypothetical protein
MEILDTIKYREYRIEVFISEAENPLEEDEFAPMLVLHERAERHFGWSTDKEWPTRLEGALDAIYQRGVTKKLWGPSGAMSIVNRWLRVAHGMRVVLPVSAIEHSGVAVYLGNTEHPMDPGGWDSGWIGWLLVGPEQVKGWGQNDDVKLLEGAKASFDEFAAWVSGDIVGYRIFNPDDEIIDEAHGLYGSDCFTEPTGWALIECRDIIDTDIAAKVSLS